MLKITKASDPIEVRTITACLYSPPGIGKTSMAFTAERPLLLDFDRGSYRAKNRRDTVQIETWADVTAITAEDLKPYGTVIVDTAGRALDVLTSHILKNNPKAANRVGGLSLQGFGELKTVFSTWTKLIRSFGIDVILIAHSDEQKDGDDLRERLDIQGGSKNEIYKACDVMGRIYLKDGKRTLNFSPTDTAFGKNPAQLPPIEVPDYLTTPGFFGGVVAQIKKSLNELSAEQTEVAALLGIWKEQIDAARTVEAINDLIPKAKESDERVRENVRRLLSAAGKALGATVDKERGIFVVPPASAATEAPAEPTKAEEKPAEREPCADDDEADRKAAEPTAAEVAKLDAEKGKRRSKAA